MKIYDANNIRNTALVSHGGSGKTSLLESLAFTTKKVDRVGKIVDGNTLSDFEPEEVKRQISINLSLIPIEYENTKLNFLDTPGYFDFVGEVRSALRVADSALLLVDAMAGIQAGTEKMVKATEEFQLPTSVIINKLDRENVEFEEVYSSIRNQFGNKYIAVFWPYFQNKVFTGVIDIMQKKLVKENNIMTDIPSEMQQQIDKLFNEIVEVVVEVDDGLLEKYLGGETLTPEQVEQCFKQALLTRKIFPVLVSSGFTNIGAKSILDFAKNYLPSPTDIKEYPALDMADKEIKVSVSSSKPLSALIFKTMTDPYVGRISMIRVYSGILSSSSEIVNVNQEKEEKIGQISSISGKNQENIESIQAGDIGVITKLLFSKTGDTLCAPDHKLRFKWISFPIPNARMALTAKNKTDEDKLSSVLPKIQEDDPSIKIMRDDDIKQTLIYAMGDTHLHVISEKLKRKFGVSIELIPPDIPYKETIRKSVKVEGKHKKQSGGHGQFGHCWLEVGPLARGEGYQFENKIFGGSIPKQYIPAVEKGVVDAMLEGVLAGYKVVDLKVTVYDGSYHPVDSSEIAFKIAGSMAIKKALVEGDSILLEPIMTLKITAPEAYMGAVIDDLNTKRGRVLGVEPLEGWQIINAQAPLNELGRYITDISSITAARGFYEMSFSHYEEAPPKVVKTVVEQAKLEKETKEKEG
jgi:elongation factor G